jgi:signal transduction histidine kinase
MEMGKLTPEVEKRTFHNARLGLGRAHHLVRNVRLLGMTEVNREKLFVPVNLVVALSDAYEQASLSLQTPSVKFFMPKVKSPCFVMADKSLTDAFVNIFRNSILYSPKKKRIDVHISPACREGHKYWEILIADYGKGIEHERRQELFTRFMKGAKGSGLGLSVVLALVTMYGGKIRVKDRVKGSHIKDSVFIVTLPAAEAPPD